MELTVFLMIVENRVPAPLRLQIRLWLVFFTGYLFLARIAQAQTTIFGVLHASFARPSTRMAFERREACGFEFGKASVCFPLKICRAAFLGALEVFGDDSLLDF